MTSVEVPYSIASALPSLTVLDITNDVRHELRDSGHADGPTVLLGQVRPPPVAIVADRKRDAVVFAVARALDLIGLTP